MSTYSSEAGEQRYTQAEQSAILTRTTAATGSTTNNSAVITHPTANFTQDDVGRAISGTGIPASTIIASWQSATQVTLSKNATATAAGTIAFTISETVVTATGGQGSVQVTVTSKPDGTVKSYRWWPLGGHAGEPRVRF